ncbi:MAG: hypothetical protein J4432_04330 [DPANN group archaeon]|nr:hypothetical protein [DPANN group archaeon]
MNGSRGSSAATAIILVLVLIILVVLFVYLTAPTEYDDPKLRAARAKAVDACETPIKYQIGGIDPKLACQASLAICDKMPGLDKVECYVGLEGFRAQPTE